MVEVVAEADEVKSYMGLMNRSLRLTLVLPHILFFIFKIKEQKLLRIKLADKTFCSSYIKLPGPCIIDEENNGWSSRCTKINIYRGR